MKYMVISEWQRYRYVANEGILYLDHIYLDVMHSVTKSYGSCDELRRAFYIHD